MNSKKPVDINSREKIKKAAKILVALGEDNAAKIMEYLDSDSIEKLIREIVSIKKLEKDEKNSLLKEFQQEIKKNEGTLTGGKDEAILLLQKALGHEKAEKYIEKLNKRQTAKHFHEFESYSEEVIAQVLSQEMAQTAAVVLTNLTSKFAAKVLKNFEASFRAQVARKVAFMQKVHPDTLNAIYKTLSSKLEKIEKEEFEQISGEEKLSAILSFLDVKSEENILRALDENDPEMARRIKESLFMFEDLIKLNGKEIRRIFEKTAENQVWAKALKGAGEELRRHIFSNISVNRSSDILEEMKIIGAISTAEIEKNRRVVMESVEKLEREGMLMLHKEKEEFVD
ncbi:MAG: hypothetical protein OEZ22_07120 [Spirochaetia bacterium]|nr:hypothetical protein [Spirochaetia bacterium]